MKQLTQRFLVKVESALEAQIGQMVFSNDDSNTVSGFVNTVNKETGECEFILFDPEEVEFTETMTNLSPSAPEWQERLNYVLDHASKDIRSMWREALIQEYGLDEEIGEHTL